MGWLTQALQTRASSGISNPSNWLFDALGGSTTATGKRVNEDSALGHSPVWAAVRLVSETAASLPLMVYERLDPRGKRRASNHPLFPVLHDTVNERQTSFEWIETSVAHLMLRGNSYTSVERDRGNRIKALWILDPRYMRVYARGNGDIMYSWEPPDLDPIRALAGSGDILHIRGFAAGNGLMGLSPITLARESIGLGLSAEEYAARFFSNSTTPSGVLEHPDSLGEDAMKRLISSLDRFRTVSNAHKTLVLEEGMKWHTVGVSPEDAQMLESRKFQVTEIARWFRVPPHKIADMEKATFSNIEQQSIEFVVDTMRPWLVRIEKAMHRDLLSPVERGKYFVEFLVDGLLRGDSKTRAESYAIGRQWGWLSANDVLEMENRNPIDGGDVYFAPLNMFPADDQPDGDDPHAQGGVDRVRRAGEDDRETIEFRAARSADLRRKIGAAMQPVFRDAALKVVRAERRTLTGPVAALTDDAEALEKLQTIVARYYKTEGELAEFARKTVEPAVRSLGEAVSPIAVEEVGDEVEHDIAPICESLSRSFGERYAARSRREITGAITAHAADGTDMQQLRDTLETRFDMWESVRTDEVAKEETAKGKSAIARGVYAAAGILVLRWVAFGDNCPICNSLNGKVVGIEQAFAEAGFEVGPPDAGITPRTSIKHPPIHGGCDCDISIG